MNNYKKKLGSVFLMAILTAVLYACTKDNNAQEKTMEPSQVVTLNDLPVYYNGKLVSAFSEIDYAPTRNADMELTSIVDTTGIYYFDQDALFSQFCRVNQMEIIYQNNSKLELIHQKAIELGIVDGDTIPQSMADYWQSVFGSDIHTMEEPNRALAIKLYDDPYWGPGTSSTFFYPGWPTLGKMDNKTSSLTLSVSIVGATVMCYNKWFGGKKRWYWTGGFPFNNQFNWSLDGHQDNNQYSSYFCVLL